MPRQVLPPLDEPVLDRGLVLGSLVPTVGPRRASSSKHKAVADDPVQYLYIQMEYCEGQTLRELIDKVLAES